MNSTACLLVRIHPRNRFLHVMVRLVDVTQRALLQALRKLVVFFPRDILMRPVQKFQCAVKPSRPIRPCVHRRVIVQVFSIIDGCLLDLLNGIIDFMDGIFFFVAQVAPIGPLQVSPRLTQIAQRVQVCGMPALGKRIAGAERKKQREYHSWNENSGNSFHGIGFSWISVSVRRDAPPKHAEAKHSGHFIP